jgi:hypothetical protein
MTSQVPGFAFINNRPYDSFDSKEVEKNSEEGGCILSRSQRGVAGSGVPPQLHIFKMAEDAAVSCFLHPTLMHAVASRSGP